MPLLFDCAALHRLMKPCVHYLLGTQSEPQAEHAAAGRDIHGVGSGSSVQEEHVEFNLDRVHQHFHSTPFGKGRHCM